MCIYKYLSGYEQQVANELLTGKSNREIAEAIESSHWKVSITIGYLLASYEAKNRTELARKILEEECYKKQQT